MTKTRDRPAFNRSNRRRQPIEARLQVRNGCTCRLGEDQTRRPGLRPMKQLDAQGFLESPHQLPDRRGRDVQLVRSGNIAQMPRGRFEGAERIQVMGRSHRTRKTFSISVAQIISFGNSTVNEHISFMERTLLSVNDLLDPGELK